MRRPLRACLKSALRNVQRSCKCNRQQTPSSGQHAPPPSYMARRCAVAGAVRVPQPCVARRSAWADSCCIDAYVYDACTHTCASTHSCPHMHGALGQGRSGRGTAAFPSILVTPCAAPARPPLRLVGTFVAPLRFCNVYGQTASAGAGRARTACGYGPRESRCTVVQCTQSQDKHVRAPCVHA